MAVILAVSRLGELIGGPESANLLRKVEPAMGLEPATC